MQVTLLDIGLAVVAIISSFVSAWGYTHRKDADAKLLEVKHTADDGKDKGQRFGGPTAPVRGAGGRARGSTAPAHRGGTSTTSISTGTRRARMTTCRAHRRRWESLQGVPDRRAAEVPFFGGAAGIACVFERAVRAQQHLDRVHRRSRV